MGITIPVNGLEKRDSLSMGRAHELFTGRQLNERNKRVAKMLNRLIFYGYF